MAEMTAEEAAEWGKTLDFPTVWATIIKLGEKIDKTAENLNKTDGKVDKTEEKIDKTTENINKLSETVNKIGEKVDKTEENLNKLSETVNKLGEKVDKTAETVNKMGEKVDKTAETVNKMGEKVDKTADTVKELSKNVGGLNGSMGELIETLFGPHLGEKFDPYQYNLKRIFKRVPIYDDTSRRCGEIDLLLSNTTVCMVLEVKRWLDSTKKVDEHIKRMQLVRQYPPAETKEKKLLGAIAGAVVTPEAREYAEQNGFFVLELAGDDVRLLESPEYFQAKEW